MCCMRRPKSHPYEVSLREGEGAGQMNTLGAEGFDLVLCAYSDLVNVVPTYLIVLHVADFKEESRVDTTGAGLKVFIC